MEELSRVVVAAVSLQRNIENLGCSDGGGGRGSRVSFRKAGDGGEGKI